RGNAPSGFGFRTDESGVATGTAVALVSDALGRDDDDPISIAVGQGPAGAPTIAAPAPLVSTVVGTRISGSSTPTAAQNAIRVELTSTNGAGVTQSQCAAFGGSWSWDATAGICACAVSSDATGAWNCSTVNLPDCQSPGAACFTATASIADLTGSAGLPAVASDFETRPPVATISSGIVNSHVVVASGTAADGVGGAAAVGATVHVVLTGTNGFTASCDRPSTILGGAARWSCPFTLAAPACTTTPCVLDGAYSATAAVLEANGSLGPAAPAALVVDTRPTSVSAPAATRNPKPSFTGHKVGDGTEIRLCEQGTACTVAAALCRVVGAGADWACAPPAALPDGNHAVVAYEVDASGGLSSPSTLASIRVKSRTATPVFAAPTAGGTLSVPVRIEGTAEPGATVAVKIDDSAALPSVTADSSGHFSVAAGVVTTGAHFAQATATDFLGNTAQSSRTQFDVSLGGQIAGSSFGCSSAGGSGTYAALLLLGLVPLLSRRRKGVALAVVVAASAGVARAEGTDLGLDNFRPASGGDGVIGVEGARPPSDGEPALEARGLLVGQSRPLVFVPDGGGASQALIRNRAGGWLTAQGHVAGPFSLGLQLPFLVQQSGDLSGVPSNVRGGATLASGLGDLRATVRAGILRQERAGFDLAVQASADLPTAKKQSFLGDSAVQSEGLAAVGYRVAFSSRSAIDLLGNAYFRMRPSRDVLTVKTGSEIGLRAAVVWLPGGGPLAPQRVVFEAEGASFLRAGFASGSVPSEWRGGISYCAGPVTFDLGIGGGLVAGVGTPGLRIIGGVGYAPSVCNPNARAAPVRPLSPVHQVEAEPAPPPKPSSSPENTDDKPAAVAAVTPAPAPKPRGNEVTILPLPELPPLPPAKATKKRTVAQADALPSMPDLPSVSALPLPPAMPGAALSGDRLELARPVAFRGSRLPAKEAMLDDVARLLSSHPEIELLGISAPDDARAKAVIAYLRKRGVAASRLRPDGRSDAVELHVLRRR
ncbi:MAG: hypothetical protein E6J61_19190, partial [Deltaproteobacteria bacterium]